MIHMRSRMIRSFITLLSILCIVGCEQTDTNNARDIDKTLYQFTDSDIQFLKRFSLSQLGEPPASNSNIFADNEGAAKFGKALFFDKEMSASGKFSCATCHQPKLYFTDGLNFSVAEGITKRSSPSVIGAAYSPWQFWDGRKDSLWSQALGPIEDASEINTSRVKYVRLLMSKYATEYQQIFGGTNLDFLEHLPETASPIGDETSQQQWQELSVGLQNKVNKVFSNAGKAMMAYQRKIQLPQSRFDQFLVALMNGKSDSLPAILSSEEVAGLRLFVGKANCASCHNGPLFTNYEFHNVGAPDLADKPVELGRYQGVKALIKDEFTCLSEWSDAEPETCAEMRFLKVEGPELVGAIKTPSLRNIAATAPYMQFGQFANLQQVIAHYNDPTPPVFNQEQHPSRPHFDILPLKLTEQEMLLIEKFLGSLTSPLPKDDPWWGLEQKISSEQKIVETKTPENNFN